MKALRYENYGGVEQLALCDVAKPVPGKGEVLVKLRATSVNLTDWEYLTGSPAYARINGLFRPKKQTLGSDIAGVIEVVGQGTTRFHVGDEVMGDILYTQGGFAEYVAAKEADLILKPKSLSFEGASTIPQAAVIAWQGLHDKGQLRSGQKVLINGAGGGTGMFAIQFAKAAGAEVTAVDAAPKLELMRSLGADHVIDYRVQDFTRTGLRYDLILDPVATRSPLAVARALAPKGAYYAVGGTLRVILSIAVVGGILSPFVGRRIRMLAVEPGAEALQKATDMIMECGAQLSIERRFPLEQAIEALAHHGAGRTLGKIVVTMRGVETMG